LERVFMDWRGALIIPFAFPAFPGKPFSTWGLEIAARSLFRRRIVKEGTGNAHVRGRIYYASLELGNLAKVPVGSHPVTHSNRRNMP
jgi:hypothetical protein